MRVLHQKLHLQHHRHTGRLLHHKHTSFRGLAVVLVVAASCMIGITMLQRAAADSLTVTGTEPVPAPDAPAIITSPADGTTQTSSGTLVAGNCPVATPQAVIVVQVDSTAAGSAVCNSDNNFILPLTPSIGSHTIVAIATSITGAAGPDSQAVQLTYRPQTMLLPAVKVAQLTPEAPFITLGGDHQLSWFGELTGDQTSYQLFVNWGDDTTAQLTIQPGSVHLEHHYTNQGSYNVGLVLRDSTGHATRQQFAAAAYTTFTPPATLAATQGGNLPSVQASATIGLYGLFLTMLSVIALVWLHADPFAYTELTLRHHALHGRS
ncbi:MAG TPA: hypothetical protein VLF69_05095 [Candidatus Saccharimonadales bacterium]|nr:hypothetical protein [Candidatus Saccharimonadales bacterium]